MPTVLSWRHLLLARMMVHGISDPGVLTFVRRTERKKTVDGTLVCDLPPPLPGEPLDADDACVLIGLRKRFTRRLVDTKMFRAALTAERARLLTPHAAAVEQERSL